METKDFLSPVWTHLSVKTIVRGEGIYVYDNEDNQYIDFTSGIGVINTGHCHPRIVSKIQKQAEKLIFGQINCVIPAASTELAEKLNKITPDHIDRFFFANSGAEATEAAVKLAKHATGRPNIIVMQGSFHGRTHLTMAMTTSKTVYRHKYAPLPAGIFVTPTPNVYYYGGDEEKTVDFCIRQLDLVLQGQTAPDETAAIIIEPVLGEGGYVPIPASYLQHLREVCDKHGILLIIDEVQSGFGRTGKFFCFEHAQVRPDIIVMAKGLGSGMPISAIGANVDLMNKWTPGTHGGTYGGGSAIAASVASETIDIIREEKLAENAEKLGKYLQTKLKELQKQYPVIGDVRGKGLMIGVEFTKPDGEPAPEVCSKIITGCLNRNLLLLACGTYKNVIRWIPPLVVTQKELDEALKIFTEVLRAV